MAETFTRFDAADYLTTEEGIAAYLKAAAEGSDPAHMLNALATVARARNMSQLARDAGISREGLYKALSPNGNPSFALVVSVARAMGLGIGFMPLPEPERGNALAGILANFDEQRGEMSEHAEEATKLVRQGPSPAPTRRGWAIVLD